ncbi:MAG: ATP-binding protein [Mariprofundaceae bacterium]|nr:ATP-binding protein [Mariprofundaceae bacterium]
MTTFDVSIFLPEFFDESASRLQSINQKLVLLEKSALNDSELIQLRRDVHTIKGSAQMFGVQDISELCHVFEDALDYITSANKHVLPMIQFLFDLHDDLHSRLKYPDAKVRLDVALKQMQYQHIKQTLKVAVATKQEPTVAVKKVQRKKKRKVSHSLIATVMNSVQEPLMQTAAGKIYDTSQAKAKEPEAKQTEVANIEFRPVTTALDMASTVMNQGSGSFLHVDRKRLSDLSNQIVELASLQLRDNAPEQQLQHIVRDFRDMKDNISDQTNDLSAGMAVQASLDHHLRQMQQCSDALRQQQLRASQMLHGVRDQMLGLMLRPLHGVFAIFPRTARDIAKRHGKKVQLLITGDAIEMDQVSAKALTEPLIHLINNAIAHGLESPQQRLAKGKPENGQITIQAVQKGNLICLDVIDDGQGIDKDKIKRKALADGLIHASECENMDDDQIQALIFTPSFSSQEKVTGLAGRGMGMSVIQAVMRELTGSVQVDSQPGLGSRVRMIFPVSTTVQQATLFRISEQRFAILSNLIAYKIPLQEQQIETGNTAYRDGYIEYQGHHAALIDLRSSTDKHISESRNSKHACILIVEYIEGFLALLVDEVLAEIEVMVRDIDPYLKRYQPVALMGCTIIHDGTVQLLLDPNGLKALCKHTNLDSQRK